ncbi:protein-arginine N5-methyltransferase [Starmerella bacillaris]|uniref:Arginine N-methyltransferase 2 n=1 Tax=Starmerella bacillaris TaxID=1247836 RepID=A0AAV5RMH3_STABA|nr:protein-arginine N5-methyltransferase [Starmerella bacillaris]
MDDLFALCALQTPEEGALDALRFILKAGMPVNIRVGELRETTEFDKQAGLLHLVCTYAKEEQFELASEMIDILFEFGANWMLLDSFNNTPGEIAYNLGKTQLYQKFVDAGFRSEILLQKFGSDSDSDEENEDESESKNEELKNKSEVEEENAQATGTETNVTSNEKLEGNVNMYLKSDLKYDNHTLKTNEEDGVMMDWETPIMKRSAELITKPGGVVLNIGFGMGIIDTFIQELKPAKHYIIEAHPTVLQRMKDQGWYSKENVVILEGTWKEKLPELIEEGITLDGLYYDTFSEHYKDMLVLFDYVVGLLNFDGTFSYFNGLGADRVVCYDVYKRVAEYNLKDYGLNLTFEVMDIDKINWDKVKYQYFKLKQYALPIVKFAGELDDEEGELI